jgi:hypothetical protein
MIWAAIESISTAVAALAAIAAGIYAAVQYRDRRGERQQASEDRARTERARLEATWPYVVASPVPELSNGRELVLRVQNYGQTAAFGVRVHFPDELAVIPLRRNSDREGYTGSHEIPLASNMLAPGQGVTESARIIGGDVDGLTPLQISVTYDDPHGECHENSYEIRFGEAAREGLSRPIVDALGEIEATLKRWTSPDKRSLLVESPTEHKERIFGVAPPAPPEAPPILYGEQAAIDSLSVEPPSTR